MFYFCGFNAFGQFGKAHAIRVRKLTDFSPKTIGQDFIFCPGWSFNIIAILNEIYFSGFVSSNNIADQKLFFPEKIKQICTSEKYCLILLCSGKLYKLSTNNLTVNEIKFADIETITGRKRKINEEEFKKENIVIQHIACGSNIAIAISSDNSVYNIPTKVFQFTPKEKIVSLQCGYEHAIALNDAGEVFTWGKGIRGQLGIGYISLQETPILVEALSGIKIVCIAAGSWHSAAVSCFGDIYTWGFNNNGQLGIKVFNINGVKNPTIYPLPQLPDIKHKCECSAKGTQEVSCSFVAVYCGGRHTIAKTSCGSIYATGWNFYGQLCLPEIEDFGSTVDEFKEICFWAKSNTSIICGPWCTIFKVN